MAQTLTDYDVTVTYKSASWGKTHTETHKFRTSAEAESYKRRETSAMKHWGIEAQERTGQVGFVASEMLPRECNGCTRGQLEQMGIQFGEIVDDLFIEARLPEGWDKIAQEHAMWSKLVDDKGRERASIFYKAAFYDRSAHISIGRRYNAGRYPVGGYDSPEYDYATTPDYGAVTDQGNIIWHTEKTITRPAQDAERAEWETYFAEQDQLAKEATDWVEKHYPDWRDPLAYWDDDETP